jgi:hypothetical protein
MNKNNYKPIIYLGAASLISNIVTVIFIISQLTHTTFNFGAYFNVIIGTLSAFLVLILPVISFLLILVFLRIMKKKINQLSNLEIFCALLPTVNLLILFIFLVYGLYVDYPEMR